MSAAVAGAAALVSGHLFYLYLSPGSGAGRWPRDRNVRRVRASVSTLCSRPRRLSGQGWPELGLERQYRSGSPQTSMRSGSTLTVACQVTVRPRPRRPCRGGRSLLDRHELAGRASLNIKQRQPDTTPSRGNWIRAQLTENPRTCLRFASSVTSTATRSPRAAQAQRLIADGGKLLLSVQRRRTSSHWEQPDMPGFGRCPSPLPGGERSRTPEGSLQLWRDPRLRRSLRRPWAASDRETSAAVFRWWSIPSCYCKTKCLTVAVWPTRSPSALTMRPSMPWTC